MIQLSKRLKAVVDLIGIGNMSGFAYEAAKQRTAEADKALLCIADVGTDHGYIPIYMVERGMSRKAIAMDINRGPLERAQAHIREHGLTDYIETRLSDGLAALKKGEAQAIVIAGMGGATMSGILEAGDDVIDSDTVLVLQPQSELLEFRNYLLTHGFSILAEDMVCEDGKYYPMMKVRKLYAAGEDSEIALRFGPLLLAQRHPVLKEFLQLKLKQKQRILERLRLAGDGSDKNAAGQEDDAALTTAFGQEDAEASAAVFEQAEAPAAAFERRSLRIAQIEEELSYIRQALERISTNEM